MFLAVFHSLKANFCLFIVKEQHMIQLFMRVSTKLRLNFRSQPLMGTPQLLLQHVLLILVAVGQVPIDLPMSPSMVWLGFGMSSGTQT